MCVQITKLCQRTCGKCSLHPSLSYQDNMNKKFLRLCCCGRFLLNCSPLTEQTDKERSEKNEIKGKTWRWLGASEWLNPQRCRSWVRLWDGAALKPPEISCFQRILWSRSLPRLLHSSTPVRRQEGVRPHPLILRPPPQQAAEHLKPEKDHPNVATNPQAPLREPEPFHLMPKASEFNAAVLKSWEFEF